MLCVLSLLLKQLRRDCSARELVELSWVESGRVGSHDHALLGRVCSRGIGCTQSIVETFDVCAVTVPKGEGITLQVSKGAITNKIKHAMKHKT